MKINYISASNKIHPREWNLWVIQPFNYFIYEFCTVDKRSKVPEIPCTFTFPYSSSLLLVQLSSCLSLTLKSPSGSTPHIMEVCRSFDHIKKIWRAHTARQSQPTHTGHFVIKQYGWFEKKNVLAKELLHCLRKKNNMCKENRIHWSWSIEICLVSEVEGES